MADNDDAEFEAVGWRFALDEDAGEIHVEHVASETSLVLDKAGDLRVTGDQRLDGDLTELHSALASALSDAAEEKEAESTEAQTAGCRVECDQSTGAVRIESNRKVTIDAPRIELDADGNLDIAASGVLRLQGSLIQLN